MGEARVVGREDEIAAALRALADPACDGVLLVAEEPGAGATTVLDAVLSRLEAQGRRANRIVASRGAAASPYAALAHVLPMPLPERATDLEPLAMFDRIRERVAPLGGGSERFVTSIDDIRWLDEQSLALLSTLLTAKLAVMLATVRNGEPVPEAVAAVERSCAIRRIPIGRLGRDDADACLAHLLPGAVDGALAHELYATSRGNPLFERELVAGGLASGAIVRAEDVWSLTGRLAPNARLTAVLDAELAGIDDAELRVLELLAICEPVDIRALERLGLGRAVTTLDDRGLVGADEDATTIHVRIVQPVLAALLRARMSPVRRRARLRDAVDALSPYAQPGDQLRLAGWQLAAGLEVPVGELLAAAQQARAAHDVEAVQRLTAAALRDEPNGEALVLQAEALQSLGRFDEAEASLDGAQRLATDERSRLAVALVRQRIMLWSGVDAASTREVLEADRAGLAHPVSRDLVLAGMATMEAIAGRPAAALELVARLESGSELAETAMAFPVAIAEERLGRPVRAAQIAGAARVRADEAAGAYGVGHGATLGHAEGLALAGAGEFGAAEVVLREAYREVVERRIPQYQAWVTSARARLDLLRGRPANAERWYLECRAVSRRIRFDPGERAAVAGLIACAGLRGDLERVRHLAQQATARWEALDHVVPDGAIAVAWRAVAGGRSDASAALIAAAADAAGSGELATANELAYEAVRFGASSMPGGLLDAVSAAEGALAAARADVVRGTCLGDVGALERAERWFAGHGVALGAAEAAMQLSRLCHRIGRTRQANAAAVRSDRYRADVGDVSSPLLARPAAAAGLSEREAEIAVLAASGLASKEIAVRLGLSVRTVSNHLQSVYTKLGVSGREHLRDVLAARAG